MILHRPHSKHNATLTFVLIKEKLLIFPGTLSKELHGFIIIRKQVSFGINLFSENISLKKKSNTIALITLWLTLERFLRHNDSKHYVKIQEQIMWFAISIAALRTT